LRASVDPATRTLRLTSGRRTSAAALPASYDGGDWHSLALEVRDGRAVAEVSHARLSDPLATASLRLRDEVRGRAGAAAPRPGAEAANVTVARPARPVRSLAAAAVPDRRAAGGSDEFDGGGLGPAWTWVRPDSAAQVVDGSLVWPTEAADLVGPGNDAGVLLRDAPPGDWAVATKVSIDLGTDTVRNFQQAGLIVYGDDDLFTRLSHVAIWNTRQTEFGKEMPFAGALSYGGTIVGPPAETTWLRVTHRTDPVDGEHELRAWTSRDGHNWVAGGVWTLPPGTHLRVGLVSHGGAGATARFDWFRTYR
jgi:arabinan endo-1,5-alpha-L-arabinosidase